MKKLQNLATALVIMGNMLLPVGSVLATHNPQHIICDSVEQVDPRCAEIDENALAGPDGLITNIVQTMVFIVGAVAVLMIVIGAIMYAISSGNPERAKTAWQTILYAIIGIIIAIFAQLIVAFVLTRVS